MPRRIDVALQRVPLTASYWRSSVNASRVLKVVAVWLALLVVRFVSQVVLRTS